MKPMIAVRGAVAALAAVAVAAPVAYVAHADEPPAGRAKEPTEFGYSIIHGQVVSAGKRKPIDDVFVTAFRTTKNEKYENGEIRASALTYASDLNDINHGYFAMWVPHGTYEVTFAKKDYETKTMSVRKGQVDQAGLGTPVRLAELPSTTIVVGASKQKSARNLTFKVGKDIEVPFSLRSRAKGAPTGVVELFKKDGRKLVSVEKIKLKGKKSDDDAFDLGKAKRKGETDYVVVYSGDEAFHSADTTFAVKVKK